MGSLRFDPPEGRGGEVTALMIQVTDDLSGVKSVSGMMRSPSGVALLPFDAPADSGSDMFVARIKIPSGAESGNWYVSNLVVYDRANNPLIQAYTPGTVPPGGTLRVSSPDSDSAAPEVRAVSMEKATVAGGERDVIRVDVVDDRSGVAGVTGAFQNPSRSALIWFACRLKTESGLWEGEIAVPLNAECGEWTVQHIRVTDNAGNVGFPPGDSSALARAVFEVASPQTCDSSPPTLDRIDLSPTNVSNEAVAEIQITAWIHDEGSGATSVTGWADGPVATNGQTPRIHFSCTKNANDTEAPWTGKILVPQYSAKGLWKLGLLHLQDRALNTRDYKPGDAAIAGAVFRVE